MHAIIKELPVVAIFVESAANDLCTCAMVKAKTMAVSSASLMLLTVNQLLSMPNCKVQ